MTNQEKATKIAQGLMNVFTSLKYSRSRVISCIKAALNEIEAKNESHIGQGSHWPQQEPGMDY